MKYRILFLSDTISDRTEIREYLSKYYKSAVNKFFTLLREKIILLKEYPYIYPIYEDDSDYHVMKVADYLVFYMINEDSKTVEIHRIFHGSQNIRQHLSQ